MDRQVPHTRVEPTPDWLFRPHGLSGSSLATPAAAVFCSALILVFLLDSATPHESLMFFGLPPLLAGMWLLPSRHARIVGATGAVVFIGAAVTEEYLRATEISICIVALLMAAAARWYASEVAQMMSPQARVGPPAGWNGAPQGGQLSGGMLLLTRRELEVARLAAGGYTAREIAAVLHISERTVENHIANVYAKLGINSRRALVKMAAAFANL